jgi:hypothetical protein
MVYAGLDLHKSFCQTKVCTKEGELIKEGRIKTEKEDIEEFFSDQEDLTIAFEASGTMNISTICWRVLGTRWFWHIH